MFVILCSYSDNLLQVKPSCLGEIVTTLVRDNSFSSFCILKATIEMRVPKCPNHDILIRPAGFP